MWRNIAGMAKSVAGKAFDVVGKTPTPTPTSLFKVVDAVKSTAVTTASAIAATATNAASTIAATTNESLNTTTSKTLLKKATEAVRAHLPFTPTPTLSSPPPPPPTSAFLMPPQQPITATTTTSTTTTTAPKKTSFFRRSYAYVIGSVTSSAAAAMTVASRGTLVAGTAVRGAATDAINATLGHTIGKVFKWTVAAIAAIAFAYGVGRSLPDAVARVLVDDNTNNQHHHHVGTHEPKQSSK
jgi:hypothetical protein